MFFYVDESGQTGVDLFNKEQPILYYGVVSSRLNLDLLAEPHLAALRRELGVDHLHAVDLGNVQLARIADRLVRLQKSLNISFDLCKIVKRDHAIISFFDQVFDQGVNPGVGWLHYWSPLRYVILLTLARLFDEDLAKLAWKARTNKKDTQAQADMVTVCQTLLARIHSIADARFVEIASGALRWAEANPAEILYNTSDKAEIKQISPNLIGFQSVLMRIADRVKKANGRVSRIVVDEQSEFNGAQRVLADFYAKARDVVDTPGPGMPVMDFRSMPDIQFEVPPTGTIRAGLELVDIHLWVFKRFLVSIPVGL